MADEELAVRNFIKTEFGGSNVDNPDDGKIRDSECDFIQYCTVISIGAPQSL